MSQKRKRLRTFEESRKRARLLLETIREQNAQIDGRLAQLESENKVLQEEIKELKKENRELQTALDADPVVLGSARVPNNTTEESKVQDAYQQKDWMNLYFTVDNKNGKLEFVHNDCSSASRVRLPAIGKTLYYCEVDMEAYILNQDLDVFMQANSKTVNPEQYNLIQSEPHLYAIHQATGNVILNDDGEVEHLDYPEPGEPRRVWIKTGYAGVSDGIMGRFKDYVLQNNLRGSLLYNAIMPHVVKGLNHLYDDDADMDKVKEEIKSIRNNWRKFGKKYKIPLGIEKEFIRSLVRADQYEDVEDKLHELRDKLVESNFKDPCVGARVNTIWGIKGIEQIKYVNKDRNFFPIRKIMAADLKDRKAVSDKIEDQKLKDAVNNGKNISTIRRDFGEIWLFKRRRGEFKIFPLAKMTIYKEKNTKIEASQVQEARKNAMVNLRVQEVTQDRSRKLGQPKNIRVLATEFMREVMEKALQECVNSLQSTLQLGQNPTAEYVLTQWTEFNTITGILKLQD